MSLSRFKHSLLSFTKIVAERTGMWIYFAVDTTPLGVEIVTMYLFDASKSMLIWQIKDMRPTDAQLLDDIMAVTDDDVFREQVFNLPLEIALNRL